MFSACQIKQDCLSYYDCHWIIFFKLSSIVDSVIHQILYMLLQLYDKTKTELCIMATNVNMMRPEYFHVKTTPNVSVKKAVRISMSIPGKRSMLKITQNFTWRDISEARLDHSLRNQ